MNTESNKTITPETVVLEISDIEHAANNLITKAYKKKKELQKLMEHEKKVYAKGLQLNDSELISSLNENSKKKTEKIVAEIKQKKTELLKQMDDNYKQNKQKYINKLFKEIIEE